MQIELKENKILGYATVGQILGGIEIDESILPENFFTEWASEKFLYKNGVVKEDPDFVPPPEPEPESSLQEQVYALQEENQFLKDCILELSKITYK